MLNISAIDNSLNLFGLK